MPKREFRKRYSDGGQEVGKYYYEHDDRMSDNTRRVSFKPGSSRIAKHSRQRDWDAPLRARLDDDDVDMSGSSYATRKNVGRFNSHPWRGGRGGGGGSRGRRPFPANASAPRHGQLKLSSTPSNWYHIIIPYGGNYPKDYVLKALLSCISPTVFIPISYHVQGANCSFYVEDFVAAQKLLNADRMFTTNNGHKLLVKVRAGNPHMVIDNQMKERLKQTMAKRYNSSTRALDLSKFHLDPDLVDNTSTALFKSNILSAVVDIIAENIPDLVALNLSNNGLYNLEHLNILAKKIPSITILHIGNNKVRGIHELDSLQELKLQELDLDGNPLCDRFQEQSVYVSEVRKRFPKVIKLDGVDLPPPIVFDVTDDQPLPTSKGSFICSEEGKIVVRQFLEQYFQLFDATSRQGLMDAYHSEALFSMTTPHQPSRNSSLASYYANSRNLMKIKDPPRRLKLLNQGKLSIVATLEKMPRTQHDLASFVVDLPLFTPQLMIVSVSGLFKEVEGKMHFCSFNRLFVIAPFGTGFNIMNDELFITVATEEQSKVAFKQPLMINPSTSIVAASPHVAPLAVASTSPEQLLIDANMRHQMVEALAQQSGMNLDWSKKCLDETQWNFERALFVFSELHKQGKVPSEAFIK